MHCDSLGFLHGLDHIIALLLSGVHRKNGQLVELDAVQKCWPETDSNSLVGNPIHSDPRVLGVHLLDNLIPLGLLVTDNK
jgi:hypothetical protein